MKKRKESKGQITMTDFVISLIIFIGVVVIICGVWSNILIKTQTFEKINDMQEKALLASSFLVEDKGYPIGWNSSNVTVLGLAAEQNIIDETKLAELLKLDNETLRERLGVPEYKVYIKMTNATDYLIAQTGENPTDQQTVLTLVSYVVYQDRLAKLYLTLWE